MTNYNCALSSTSTNLLFMQQMIFPQYEESQYIVVNSDNLLKRELIGFCFAAEATSTYSLTRLAFHSTIILILVIDYLLLISE